MADFLDAENKAQNPQWEVAAAFWGHFDYFNFFGTDLQIRSEFSKLEKQNDMIEQIDQFVLKKFALDN